MPTIATTPATPPPGYLSGPLGFKLKTVVAGVPPAPVAPTNLPPTLTILEPLPGSALRPTDTVRLRATDPEGFRRVVISVVHRRTGLEEVAFNGAHFTLAYDGSTRVEVDDGWDFTLRRTAGWPAGGFELKPLLLDVGGQEPLEEEEG